MHPQIERTLKSIYPKNKPEDMLIKLEKAMEKDMLNNLFPRLEITASQKTDRKSLPYQHEIIASLENESWMQGMLEYHRCYRRIVSELIEKEVYKIRFYVHVETADTKLFNLGKIVYKFRYYNHPLK